MTQKKNAGRFKDWALKSGFPFENDVHSVIVKKFPESSCKREVSFLTSKNDESMSRSVDFLVTLVKNTRNFGPNFHRSISENTQVQLVIDAKYTADEYYMFIPSKRKDSSKGWPSLIPIRKEYDLLARDEVNKVIREPKLLELALIPESIQITKSGKKVKELNNERDRASVQEAQIQVLQAVEAILRMVSLSSSELSKETLKRNATIIVPIIVTNAPLLVLKDHVTTELIEKTDERGEIFSEVNSVVVEFPNNYEYMTNWSDIKSRFDEETRPIFWDIERMEFPYVYFCNLDGLDELFEHIKKVMNEIPT